MPRETDCGCCEAQRAFVVCYECGKGGNKKSVPLCKDCSSFIHRGLLSGHQVSSIGRHNDRHLYDSPAQTQVKTEPGFYESHSSKGNSGLSYAERNESSTRSSSKYGDRNGAHSTSQNRSNSNYTTTDQNKSRSTSGYVDRTESHSVAQAASSSTYNRTELYPEPGHLDDAITHQESNLAANGLSLSDYGQTTSYPDSRIQRDYGDRNSLVGFPSDRDDNVVTSTYPTHQPMPSLPNQERGRPGVYPLLPKVRYMDDEIFKVEVNSSLHPDGTFWAALVRTEAEEEEFKRFEDDLGYSASSALSCDRLEQGAEVLANVKSTWCRAKMEYDIDSLNYKIRQTDYGSSARVNQNRLKNLPLKFYTVPYQALRCCIASKEVETFDRDSQSLFHTLTERRSLVAQVIQCDTQNKTFYVKLLQNLENGLEQINISERVLQKAAISLGHALPDTKALDLRVTKYFSSESSKDDVTEVKLSGDPLDPGNRKRSMVMINQRQKVLRGTVMPKTDEHGQPRCFHCNHYGHFAKFCPRKTCRGWKRKK
ncbi:uncharacterized protein LOC135493923 isoform X2 [Lineus longissimus]|uniref:uncharacterized protein LOC135493923 isoform X2 n=1 Tax=Lineus longissimus TaxID=88925 RepID=UPI00315C873C